MRDGYETSELTNIDPAWFGPTNQKWYMQSMKGATAFFSSHRKSDVCTPKGNIDGSLVKVLSQTVVFNYEEHQKAAIDEKSDIRVESPPERRADSYARELGHNSTKKRKIRNIVCYPRVGTYNSAFVEVSEVQPQVCRQLRWQNQRVHSRCKRAR